MDETPQYSARDDSDQIQEDRSRLALSIFKQIMSSPGGTVERATYLRHELREYCSDRQITLAIEFRPALADVPSDVIDRLADKAIRSHYKSAGATSLKQAIPGIDLLPLNLTSDDSQILYNAVVMSQKPAYLYGMPDFLKDGLANEETYKHVAILVYSMFGVENASKVLNLISKRFAQEVRRRLPRLALTKTSYYPVVKKSLRWVGIGVTKVKFAVGIAIAIQVVVATASATATTLSFRGMARKLKNHLRELEFAKPPRQERLVSGKS